MELTELRQKVNELPPIEPYSLANPFWDERRSGLRYSLMTGDINTFLQWPDIGFTMFLGNWPWVDEEYTALQALRPDWLESGALNESYLGGPEIYRNTGTSANVIHQAYHLMKWEMASGRKVQDLKSICEIGGGYGAMCKLIHRLGFSGKYYIYDLPEVDLLQEFYLSQTAGVPYQVEWGKALPATPELILGLWSFSEMPSTLRDELTAKAKPRHWFFGYQFAFEGVHNPVYFAEFQKQRPGYSWITEPIKHHPGESWYLYGNKK